MNILIPSFLFVFLYSSGFVATQYGMPFADPVSFLVIRFAITTSILGIACLALRLKLPRRDEVIPILVAGMLIIGVFSLGVFLAIDYGISGSTTALIISFQPLMASLIAKIVFKAPVTRMQWIGLWLGLIGVGAIVFFGLTSFSFVGIAMAFLGLFGVACGSVYQKYYCSAMSLMNGGFLQSLSACILCSVVWLMYPSHFINWTSEFIFSLLWMAIVVSIGALSLLYILIHKLSISKVSTLFYLVPVAALFLSLLFLGATLSIIQSVGIVLVSLSIFLIITFDKQRS